MEQKQYTNATTTSETSSTTIHETKHFPFIVVQQNEDFHLAVGNNYITENVFTSLEEANAYLEEKPWDILINFICLTCQKVMQNETKSK